MKYRKFILFLLLMVVNFAWAEQVSKDVNVYFTIGPGCWVKLIVHPDVDLGNIVYFDPGQELVDDKNNLIQVITNCQECTFTAQVIDIQTPSGFEGSIPQDFYWKVERHHHHEILHDWASLAYRDMLNSPFVIENVKAGRKIYNIGYKYILDALDIPGNYLVKFLYTLTAP